jgi:uncharacterized protein YkwD
VKFPVRSTLAFWLSAFLLLWCVTPGESAERDRAGELLERVNQLRQERHLLPLRASAELAAVAQAYAEELVQRGEIDHISRSGRNPLQRVQAAGIAGFSLLAENLGRSSVQGPRLEAIVRGWLASPVHRENLLNPAFNTSGAAVLRSASGETFAVQLYACIPAPGTSPR